MKMDSVVYRAATAVEINHDLDGESRQPFIISSLTVACVLSTATVIARLYTRLFVLRTFGRDDFAIGVAQVLTLMTAAAIYLETSFGLGKHTWLMATTFVPYMQSFYASIIVFNVATCIVKISILLQYRRLFQVPLMRKLTLFGLLFLGAWAVTLSILLPLVCTPVYAFWDATVPGKCLHQLAIWYVMAALNLVSDVVIFSMPLPVIKNLQLPRGQKVMLMGVFCLGFCPCIISVYRITTLQAAASTTDPAWENTDAAVWSLLELAIGVTATCLPTVKPLLAMALPCVFKSSLTSRARVCRAEEAKTSRGQKYGNPRVSTHSQCHARGVMGPKDVDGDTDALSASWASGSPGPALEMQTPTYNVSVSGGGSRDKVPYFGGIRTITVVTQTVDPI